MYRRLLLVVLACGGIAVVFWTLHNTNGPWHEAAGTGVRRWLQTTTVEDAVVVLIATTAIACAAWLILTTLLVAIARVTRIPGIVGSAAWLTPAPIRRLVERIAVPVLVASALATTPVGAEDPPVFVDADGSLLPPALSGSVPIPAEPTGPLVTVLPGDNLWSISRRHLAARTERQPDIEEIAAYWRQVVDHNRSRLSSGNPDLIYPGEVIAMPPTG